MNELVAAASSLMAALGWVDWLMLGVLALSTLTGLSRGLLFELMSLAGWVIAYVSAQVFSAQLAPYVPIGSAGSSLNLGAAFVSAFVAALMVWGLLARLLRLAIRATPLTVLDRLLGAVFGLARGVLVLLVVATALAYTPAVRSPAWQDSRGAAWLAQALTLFKPMLPVEVARLLP